MLHKMKNVAGSSCGDYNELLRRNRVRGERLEERIGLVPSMEIDSLKERFPSLPSAPSLSPR